MPGTSERPREAYPYNWAEGPRGYPLGMVSKLVYVLEMYIRSISLTYNKDC